MKKKDLIEKLKKDINAFFKVSIEKGTKTNTEVYARIIYYKLYKIIDPTITSGRLGETVGKAHATVLYALKKVDTMYIYDKKFKYLHDSFMLRHPEYLKQHHFKKIYCKITESLSNITDFVADLDFEERALFMIELEKLKNQFIKNNIENEGVL